MSGKTRSEKIKNSGCQAHVRSLKEMGNDMFDRRSNNGIFFENFSGIHKVMKLYVKVLTA